MFLSFLRRDEPSASDSPYNYLPTQWICILFIALFSCTSLVHIVQAIRYRCIIPFPTSWLMHAEAWVLVSQDVAFDRNCGTLRHRRGHWMEWTHMDVVQSAASRGILYGVSPLPQPSTLGSCYGHCNRVVTTIISPSFFTAAIFALLGRIIRRVGPEYSLLTPRWCECKTPIFRLRH
jgi:hypothetical protein